MPPTLSRRYRVVSRETLPDRFPDESLLSAASSEIRVSPAENLHLRGSMEGELEYSGDERELGESSAEISPTSTPRSILTPGECRSDRQI